MFYAPTLIRHLCGMSTPGIASIGQIAVVVKDLDRALNFYRDVLGLPHLFSAGKMAFFNCGGVRLMLTTAETAEFDHPASIIYYRVPAIQESHRVLLEKGVVFQLEPRMVAKMPDHELWMAFLKDSEGNTLALMSEVRA